MSAAGQARANDEATLKFHIADIPSLYGKELSSRLESNVDENEQQFYRVIFQLLPCADLIIKQPLDVELICPLDFHIRGGITVITRNHKPFSQASLNLSSSLQPQQQQLQQQLSSSPSRSSPTSSSMLSQSNPNYFTITVVPSTSHYNYYEVSYSWLKKTRPMTNYPLSVWFYTIRNSLKNPKIPLWRTPLLLYKKFPKSSRVKSSSSSSSSSRSSSSSVSLIAGVGRTKGRRGYMEDVDFIFPSIRINNSNSTVSVYGVLDGHGGKECAAYLGDEMPMKIATLMRAGTSSKISPPEALFNSFRECDADFLKSSVGNPSGSTANVLLWVS